MIIEQRSEEWFKIRKGKITSSEIHKIMGAKDTMTDTAKTYLLEKVSESLGGYAALVQGIALDWGTELEDLAIKEYSEKTGTLVEKASFIPVGEYYGGSPDGLIQPDGIIEVKCPYNSSNHFKHGLIKTSEDFKKIATNYYYQCISNMICAEAQWCDFISYDPRVESKYKMFVFRLNRNEEEVENMVKKVEVAAKYMMELREKIQNAVMTKGVIEG
jgi:putative phage-type endonuclease